MAVWYYQVFKTVISSLVTLVNLGQEVDIELDYCGKLGLHIHAGVTTYHNDGYGRCKPGLDA